MNKHKRVAWGPAIRSNMIRMVLDEGRQVADVSAEWGVPATTVATWASRERARRRRASDLVRAEADLIPVTVDEVEGAEQAAAMLAEVTEQLAAVRVERDAHMQDVSILEAGLQKIREILDELI